MACGTDARSSIRDSKKKKNSLGVFKCGATLKWILRGGKKQLRMKNSTHKKIKKKKLSETINKQN